MSAILPSCKKRWLPSAIMTLFLFHYLSLFNYLFVCRVQNYNKKSVPTRVRTNGRTVSDKWSDKTTDCRTNTTQRRILLAYFRLFICSRRHAELGTEVTGESVGAGETAGLAYLLNSDVGLVVHQSDGIIKAQFADVCR